MATNKWLANQYLALLLLFLQVDNAATKGASAVLIYPDPKDYDYRANTPLYGHVCFVCMTAHMFDTTN